MFFSLLLVACASQAPDAVPASTPAPSEVTSLRWLETAAGFGADDEEHGWRLALDTRGLTVVPMPSGSVPTEDWTCTIGTASFGRAGRAEATKPGAPGANGSRVELDHGALQEWFVRDAHGVEHGWTIPSAPEGDERAPLWIGLRVEGDLSMHIVDDGSGAFLRDARGVLQLRYGYLKTYDGTGAVIPSRIAASPFGVGIEIDARQAQYPITVDPVISPSTWSYESNVAFLAGGGGGPGDWVMGRAAGDVNGDGFSDILFGAAHFQGPAGVNEGRVSVFHGGPNGPSPNADWYVDGGALSWQLGGAVAGLGDLNGDGYDDIGASSYGTPYFHVWFGGPGGLGPTGLTVASADFSYFNLLEWSMFLAPAGDLNGDGYDDFAVSAPTEDNGALLNAGAVYVFFGSATGPSNTPWIQRGNQADGQFGLADSGGDVNGDGFSDLTVGERFRDISTVDQGRAYCFHGGPGFSTDHTPDWSVDGDPAFSSSFGFQAKAAGDVDGDGYGDVIVGAPYYSAGGRAYLYRGGPAGLGGTPQAIFDGPGTPGTFAGHDVGSVGDVDGDGFGDFVVGSLVGAWIHHGRAGFSGAGALPAQYLSTTTDQLGLWSGGAGDVNGDGFSDVVLSRPNYSNGQTREGRIDVYFGSPNTQPSWPVALVEPGALTAGATASRTGRSVSSAGDVNADGFNDIVVGSPEFGATDNGRVQVFLGGANGPNLSSPFWTFTSPNSGENFGWSVSAGDVDNDGKSDIVVGAPRYSNGQIDEGRAYLFRSTGAGISASPTWTFESNEAGALFGSAVSALGDVNADGFSDMAIGAPGATSNQGSVTLFHGRATLLSSITAAITITSGIPGSEFGTALALVGDLDLDGFGDLAVGAPKIDNPQVDEGRVYSYLGSYSGITGVLADDEESQQAGALFGSSIAQCGDINGDGRAEILVGAPGYNAATNGGAAFLLHAVPAGPSIALATLTVRFGEQANSQYGFAVSAGGDVNGDGWNDVLVGAPDFDGNLSNQGRVYLYLGSSTGLAGAFSESYDGTLANARFGESIALGGDVNGDGLSDPIGGVPSANGGDGAVLIFSAGGNTACRVSSMQRQVNDLQALQVLGRTSEVSQFQINLGVQNAAGNTATTIGRALVKLEWEIQPLGTSLNGSAIQGPGTFADSGALGSGARLSRNITGLQAGTAYHWRARTAVRNVYYPHTRWTTIQLNGLQEAKLGLSADCNNNGIGDTLDIAGPVSEDCNGNTFPDECEVPPLADPQNPGTLADCNQNLVPDVCEYDPLFDCDSNGILDECQMPPFGNQDCNGNFVVDACDIASASSLDTNGDAVPDDCVALQPTGSPFCPGDGSGVACPCGNSSPLGGQDGCMNSLGSAGRLRATGIARVAFDNFTLLGSGMPNSSALYFQGTTQQTGGNGAVFGDGKRCAAGSVTRLGTKINSGGASQYPAPGDLSVSVKGMVPAGGAVRTYQSWYRNAAAFCTASTFNLTNGYTVTWVP